MSSVDTMLISTFVTWCNHVQETSCIWAHLVVIDGIICSSLDDSSYAICSPVAVPRFIEISSRKTQAHAEFQEMAEEEKALPVLVLAIDGPSDQMWRVSMPSCLARCFMPGYRWTQTAGAVYRGSSDKVQNEVVPFGVYATEVCKVTWVFDAPKCAGNRNLQHSVIELQSLGALIFNRQHSTLLCFRNILIAQVTMRGEGASVFNH